jgi:hypothetical protein
MQMPRIDRFFDHRANVKIKANVIPNSEQTKNIENIAKDDAENSLRKATANTKKGQYSKGKHSFEILRRINPHKVTEQSPWAKRFVILLSEKMQSI